MKSFHLAVVALSLAIAWPAAAAINTTQDAAPRVETSNMLHEAKLKLPKIHKCRPIKNGVECEIKISELSPREQAARAAAEEMAKARAAAERNQQKVRDQDRVRQQEIENNKRIDDAKRRGKTA